MSEKKKITAKEREKKLLAKIESAKKALVGLQEKRKKEIGALAYKHGLEDFENKKLDKAFATLAKELSDGNP